ncbi:glycosyltransferase family 4 protein [Alienimonas californiensis]|uniref:Putative glycosyl transferase n=1 Tax=Alienimonas californiensis TaxID=2527989 RepID=A0A517P8I1_9PLAN|nr:glycosyltransferase family 4 protein [Alienimonas californiensis]QDT15683.1 putative glycosyl transferase [Alienimonas californiensis]
MWNARRLQFDLAARPTVAAGPPRALFLNRSYRPDAEATGQLLTELTEDLAAGEVGDGQNGEDGNDALPGRLGGWRVHVICGRPNSNPEGLPAKSGTTLWRGVTVQRVWHTRWAGGAKRSLVLRSVDYCSFLFAALLRGALVRRVDVVVAETDPFPLAVVGRLLAWRHRARFVVHAQDVHPELGVALGVLNDGPAVRAVRALMHAAVRTADAVVTLSTDMRRTFQRMGVPADRIAVLPNWADADAVRPVRSGNRFRERHGLGEPGEPGAKFVVMHSGNMGRTQRLEDVLAAAARLSDDPRILFLLVGGGAAEAGLKAGAQRLGLTNLRFLPYQPKSELSESLSAADLHLVCTDARVIPYLMPSKLYGVLAAGAPALCVAPADSELAATVTGDLPDDPRAEPCGWTCEPDDVTALTETIAAAAALSAEELRDLGDAGRQLAEGRFSRAAVTPRFAAVLRAVTEGTSPAQAARPVPSSLPDTLPLCDADEDVQDDAEACDLHEAETLPARQAA